MEIIRLSDFTVLDEKFLTNCEKVFKKLNEYTVTYNQILDLPANKQLVELESLKRKHSSFMAYLADNYISRIRAYYENNEFLAYERKQLKAKSMNELLKTMTANKAGELVYDDPNYVKGMATLQKIRELFYKLFELYKTHSAIQQNIYQSISVMQKEVDLNNKA